MNRLNALVGGAPAESCCVFLRWRSVVRRPRVVVHIEAVKPVRHTRVKNVCGVRSASGSGIDMQITRRGGPRGRATGLFGGVVRRVGPLCGRWPTVVGRMFLRTATCS